MLQQIARNIKSLELGRNRFHDGELEYRKTALVLFYK